MSLSFLLALGLVAVLVAGVVFSVIKMPPGCKGGQAQAGPAAQKRLPMPVFVACAVPLVAFVFYMAGGYPWLAQVAGAAFADAAFMVLQMALPVVGVLVCGGYYIVSRARLRYFFLLWLCLVLAVVGFGARFIGQM